MLEEAGPCRSETSDLRRVRVEYKVIDVSLCQHRGRYWVPPTTVVVCVRTLIDSITLLNSILPVSIVVVHGSPPPRESPEFKLVRDRVAFLRLNPACPGALNDGPQDVHHVLR